MRLLKTEMNKLLRRVHAIDLKWWLVIKQISARNVPIFCLATSQHCVPHTAVIGKHVAAINSPLIYFFLFAGSYNYLVVKTQSAR